MPRIPLLNRHSLTLPSYLAALLTLACGAPPARVAQLDSPVPPTAVKQFMATADGRLVLGWLEPLAGDTLAIRVATRSGTTWSAPHTVVQAPRLVDASLIALGGRRLGVTWLITSRPGTEQDPIEGHDVYLTRSLDGGESWETPVRANRETRPGMKESPTLGAFTDGSLAVAWSDMRTIQFTPPGTPDGEWGMKGMTSFIGTTMGTDGVLGPEVVLDDDFCDCCIPAFAASGDELLLTYREHRPDNVREIAVMRWSRSAHTPSTEISTDRWVLDGCPSKGPAIARMEGTAAGPVGLAWFTQAEGRARVKIAFSKDDGRAFGPPITLDSTGSTRVLGVTMLGPESALVSWVGISGTTEILKFARVEADGRIEEATTLTAPDSTGFGALTSMSSGDSTFVAWSEAEGKHPRLMLVRRS